MIEPTSAQAMTPLESRGRVPADTTSAVLPLPRPHDDPEDPDRGQPLQAVPDPRPAATRQASKASGQPNSPSPRRTSARLGAWTVAGDLPTSFRYAAQGLVYGIRSQRNFRIHVVIGSLVFALGLWLQLPTAQLAVLVLTVAAVLVLELINTATEAVVDLAIGRQFHPLARIAKDCAAAAVLVAALASLLVAVLLLAPPLLARLGL
jgi:diacylglycerol kinase (ATP)